MFETGKLIKKCEAYFEKNRTIFSAFLLIQRYYISYITEKNKYFLNKAYHTSVTMFNENTSNMELLLYVTFFDICLGNYDKADENLIDINKYKKYLKNNEPVLYGGFIYLLSLNDFCMGKNKSALKNLKILEEYAVNLNKPELYAMTANLYIEVKKDFLIASKYLTRAYSMYNRSIFLYLSLYRFYTLAEHEVELLSARNVLIQFLNWAITHNIDLKNVLIKYKDKMNLTFFDYNFGIKIYEKYQDEWILKCLCKFLISNFDYSEKAFYFYQEAVVRQLDIKGINDYFIKSGFKNNIEDLNPYPVKLFLEDMGDDLEIKPYIYHIILTDKKFSRLADKYKNDILQFGFYSLDRNLEGRYYNSIYKFILDNEYNFEISSKFIQKAENKIYFQMFLYEISVEDTNVGYIFIREKEKKETEKYEIINGKAEIRASSDNFSYYLLDKYQKEFISTPIKITRMVENLDIKTVLRFYEKRLISNELLISLGLYYLNIEFPQEKSISVFNLILKNETSISKSFRMKIIAAIGNIYYNMNEYKKSVKYYKSVDERYLTDKNIENMINVFINTGELGFAVDMLVKKGNCISDRTKFYVVKKAAKEEKFHKILANAAYELLSKSWYDKIFVKIVLNYYKGSQKEFEKLSFILDSMDIGENELDEVIIKNGIWMHTLDKGLEKVFVNMYERNPQNECIKEFVNFCCYEILVNSVSLEKSTVKVLEKIYFDTDDSILSYSLGHVYIQDKVITTNSNAIAEDIITSMEQNDIMFPIFKNCKDKRFNSPYIEKNKAFIYRTFPGKNVLLYYRALGDEKFLSKRFKYLRFGLYCANIPVFFNETIEYYISEQMENGSIETKIEQMHNNNIFTYENSLDEFFIINNAFIYGKMFKYDMVESVISQKLAEKREIKGQLL